MTVLFDVGIADFDDRNQILTQRHQLAIDAMAAQQTSPEEVAVERARQQEELRREGNRARLKAVDQSSEGSQGRETRRQRPGDDLGVVPQIIQNRLRNPFLNNGNGVLQQSIEDRLKGQLPGEQN